MDSLYINKGKEKIRKNDTKTKYIYIEYRLLSETTTRSEKQASFNTKGIL